MQKLLLPLCALLCTCLLPVRGVKADTVYGLDAAAPIGAFLNGVFPPQAPGLASGYSVTQVFPSLQLDLPTYMAPYPGTNKMLLTEKTGQLVLFDNSPTVSTYTTFLDLSAKTFTSSDCGLTYFAFHPEFGKAGSPNRGFIYITYKYNCPLPGNNGHYGYWRLSRFTVPDGQMTADPASEVIYIQQFDEQEFHDSGCLMFGPDGYLYAGIGDEGGENDDFHSSQKINDRLFSGILRIDVDQNPSLGHPIRRQPLADPVLPANWPASYTQGYYIPNDNPFVDTAGGNLEEFYALGLRNPYRFNYDPASGLTLIGDVGQDTREELDILTKGANYGWNFREGTIAGPGPVPSPIIGTLTDPIWDYPHGPDGCIIGGYVYHGQLMPGLLGKYITVDNVSGIVRALTLHGSGSPEVAEIATLPSGSVYSGTSSMAQDASGELYFIKVDGTGAPAAFYQLTPSGSTGANPPALLSQTGAFSDLPTLTPVAGLIPYAVNAPLWSDGAVKQRWMAVPYPGTPIKFAPDTDWTFPVGTVFVKNFALPIDDTNPAITRRLETRFFVISSAGEPYGVTYRWRPDGSDADLLTAGASEAISINTGGGATRTQTWSYPSRSDCMVCHNANANHTLGVKTHQLNGDFTYPSSGRTANQLLTLGHIGLFDTNFHAQLLPFFLKSANVADASATLETRVRSYIDANCAQCHRPNGGALALFDARYTTGLANQGLIYGALESVYTGAPESVIQPGDTAHSILYYRENQVGPQQMPPLAKNVVDATASQAIRDWINSLNTGPAAFLSAPATTTGPFTVNVGFNQSVSGLAASSFVIDHGSASALTGSGLSYTVTVAPSGSFPVTIDLPAGAATNAAGKPSYAAATATVAVVEPNLVTWLKLDETSGTIAADSSLNNNSGQLASGPALPWIPGHFGNALAFNVPGENLALRNVAPNDFTLSCWLRTTQVFPTTDYPYDGAPLFFSDIGGFTNDFVVGLTRSANGINRVTFCTGHANGSGDSVLSGSKTVNTGKWVHVAFTRVQATGLMSIYVNGVLDTQSFGSTDSLTANPTITMGLNPANTSLYYTGALDEVRIYNRALSATEVAALTSATQPIDYYADWANTYFPGLTHLQTPTSDPDGDGRTNAQEFFFGGNPLVGDNFDPVLAANSANGGVTLQFLERTAGATYTLLASHDLLTWSPVGSEFSNLQYTASPDVNYQWVTGDYLSPTGAPETFFRLQAVENY